MKVISIVVPCFNEEGNIQLFKETVSEVFTSLPYRLELIFVDDGSTDSTIEVIERLAREDERVKLIQLSRNFGQQAATAAGLSLATGDAVMIMDADLQHPPSLIPAFINSWEAGYPVVFGVRERQSKESLFRHLTSRLANTIFSLRHARGLPYQVADFSIIDRKAVEAFKRLPPQRVMTRYRIARVAKKRAYISFPVTERVAGASKYTYSKLLRLFCENIFARSRTLEPLYVIARTNIEYHV